MKERASRVCFLVLPLSLLGQPMPQEPVRIEIRVLQGEGAIHQPAERRPQPLVVQVVDEAGRPVEGALVSFRMPSVGPGGLFSNGLPSEIVVTGKDGRASARVARWNQAAGPFHIRVTAARKEARAGILVPQTLLGPPTKEAGRELQPGAGPLEREAQAAGGPAGGAGGPDEVEAPAGVKTPEPSPDREAVAELPPFKPRRRWLKPFLIAAGIAAGGVTTGFAVSRRVSASGQPAESGVSIGPPAITIGPPK